MNWSNGLTEQFGLGYQLNYSEKCYFSLACRPIMLHNIKNAAHNRLCRKCFNNIQS